MHDDLSRFITSGGSRGTAITPEKLELMGKEAANLLVEKSIPLNDSITKMAASLPEINSEQVRRVVEFANTASYLNYHEQHKTAGADSSYPQFDLADADVVLHNLSADHRPEASVDISYGRAPEKQKISTAKLETELETLFLGTEKRASLDFTPETVVHHIMDAKDHLISLKNSLEHSGEQLDMLLKEAEASYYDDVKHHLLDGGSFADVVRGAMEIYGETDRLKEAMVPVLAQLLKEKVCSAKDLERVYPDLEKVASRIVDQEHPFVATAGAIASLREEIEKIATSLVEVDASLVRVKTAIREEFLDRH